MSEPIAEWAAAFTKAQSEMPTISKGETADTGSYKYKYASLDAILEVVRPVLNANGLSVAQSPVTQDGKVGVETRIYHSAGHVEVFGPLFLDGGKNAQGAGSAITYAKRYSLCAALGIAPEEDDDGAKAVESARPQQTGQTWLADAVAMFSQWSEDQRREKAKEVMGELGVKNPLSLTNAKKVHAAMSTAYYEEHPSDEGRPF